MTDSTQQQDGPGQADEPGQTRDRDMTETEHPTGEDQAAENAETDPPA